MRFFKIQALGLALFVVVTLAFFSCETRENCSQEWLTRSYEQGVYQICKNGLWQPYELDPFKDIPDGACLWVGIPERGCRLSDGELCLMTRIVECPVEKKVETIPENERFESFVEKD